MLSITKVGFIAALLAASSVASAQVYVGGSVGRSSTSFDSSDFSLGLPTLVSESQDKTDTAYKLFVGYNFDKVWAIEGGYTDLGKPKYKYTGINGAAGTTGQGEVKESAWFLAGKGTLHVSEQFNVFGKLGVTRNKAEVTANTNNAAFNALAGLPVTASDSKWDLLVGVGVGYDFTKQLGLRLEYEDFGKFGDQNKGGRTRANLWSLGLEYRF